MRVLLATGHSPAPSSEGTLRVHFDAWDVPAGDVSLPGLMTEELLELRNEHAAWAYRTGLVETGSGTLSDALAGGSSLSMWWCSTLYERHPKVSPDLYNVYRLRALERLMVRVGADSLTVSGLPAACEQALSALCAAKGWSISASESAAPAPKSALRKLYDACPAPFRAGARFAHWLLTVKKKLPRTALPEPEAGTGTIVTYFPNIDLKAAKAGVLRSRYWESLHDALAAGAGEDGVPAVRWLFVRFPSPQGTLDECLAYRDGFAASKRSGVSFQYLEEFLGVRDMLQAFGRYLRVAMGSLRAQGAARKAFRFAGSDLDLWPLLGHEYAESFRGWRCLERCLQRKGIENYAAEARDQRWYTFPMENCPWERMVTHAVRATGKSLVLGAQHSTIRPTDFRYFDDPATWTDPETELFQPHLIAGNGESACSQWRAAGVPEHRLAKIEALRYLYLGPMREEALKAGGGWSDELLVVTSFFADETDAHLELLAACVKEGLLDPRNVTVKPHPYLPVEERLKALLGERASLLRISTAPMPEELKKRPVVWASNSTTAVLEAAIMGLPVLVMRPAGDFDLCPLQDIAGLPRTSDVESVRLALADIRPLEIPEGYLNLDTGLSSWKKLLGLKRGE